MIRKLRTVRNQHAYNLRKRCKVNHAQSNRLRLRKRREMLGILKYEIENLNIMTHKATCKRETFHSS